MSDNLYFHEIVAGADGSRAMESETIQKNGASPKSHTSRGNFSQSITAFAERSRSILFILLAMMILPLVAKAQFSGGSGTSGSPYIITTASQLFQLMTFVNAGSTTYNNKCYRLNNDISLSGYQDWIPIGTASNPFKGVFDGNFCKITDLDIDNSSVPYVGLFGYVQNGTIKNVGLERVTIFTSGNFNNPYYRGVGGVAGLINGSDVSHCYSTGIINASVSGGNDNDRSVYAGGVVGWIQGSSSVSNCYSACRVTANVHVSNYDPFRTPPKGRAAAGGVAGRIESNDGSVSNSYATGAIFVLAGYAIANFAKVDLYRYVGGIVGRKQGGSVSNCAALNSEIWAPYAYSGEQINSGRIVGVNSGTLTNNVAYNIPFNGSTISWNDGISTIYLTDINTDGTIGGRFTSTNGWTTQNGMLPILIVRWVTFNANGGTVSPTSGMIGYDGMLVLSLPTPTRTGYIFNGWYTAPIGGDQVWSNTVFSVSTTIYAQWILAPTNDQCTNATLLPCNTTVQGNLTSASPTTNITYQSYPGYNDVFYYFTASSSGNHIITLSNFSNDKDLFLHSNCSSTTALASSAGTTSTETITYSCTANTTYIIRITDYSGTGGTFNIGLNCPPAAPTAPSPQNFCSPATVANLTATGTSIKWYTTSSGGTALSTSASLATGTYYASQTVNGLESSRTQVTVNISTPPTAPTSISGNTTICSGSSTTLTASGGSGGSGCTYQWYSGSCGSGSVLGTGSSLSVSPTSNTTYYVRRVGNTPCNSITTTCASVTVTVTVPPTAPTSISGTTTICSGSSTTLTAEGGSEGSGCTYQWYSGSCGSGSVLGIGASLPVNPISNTTYYVRRVGNTPCSSITTTCASVTVNVTTSPTAPTSISGNTTICSGSSTTLTAEGGSEGSGCTYQWYSGSCGSGSVLGTGSSLPVSPTSNTTYYVRRVGSSPCNSITTTCAQVTVTVNPILAPSVIIAASGGSMVCDGTPIIFTATPTDGGLSPTYQWQVNGENKGDNAPTYIYDNPANSAKVICIMTPNSSCAIPTTATSNEITVTVNTPPTAPTSISGNTTICSGSATTLTATGGSEGSGCTYQWYSDSCGSGSVLGTGSSLPVSPTSNTTYYVRRVGNTPCNSITTTCATVTVTVSTPPTAPTSVTPSNSTICSGDPVTLTAAGGSSGSGCTYEWGTGTCGANIITGQTGDVITESPTVTTTYWVRRIGTSPCNNTTTCATVTVTVSTPPTAPTDVTPSNSTICSGDPVTLTAAGGSSGSGCTYEWGTGTCGSNVIADKTDASITESPTVTTTYWVRRVGTPPCNNTTECAFVEVSVNAPPTAPTNITPSSPTICFGDPVTLTAAGGSSGSGCTYEWGTGTCGSNIITGQTGDVITESPTVTTTYWVRRKGTSPCNDITTCATVTVTVSTPPTAPTSVTPSNSTICSGDPVTLTAAGGSSGSGCTYEWGTGTCGANIITGQTGDVITESPTVTTTYWVRRVGTSPCNNTTACAFVEVSVNAPPTDPTSITPSSPTICFGDPVTLTAAGGSEGSGCTYEWGTGVCGSNVLVGKTDISITESPTVTTTYWVRRVGNSLCNNTTECAFVEISVNTPPTAPTSITSSNPTICFGNPVTLTAEGGSSGSGCTYEWGTGTCGANIITGKTDASITESPIVTTTYWVRRVGVSPCNNTTGCVSITITVITVPPQPTMNGPSSLCEGNHPGTYYATLTGSITDYDWNWTPPDDNWTITVTGGVGNIISATPGPNGQSGYLIVEASNMCGTTVETKWVTVETAPTAPEIITTANTTICYGDPVTLTAAGGSSGNGCTYEWGTGACGSNIIVGKTDASITEFPTVTTTYWVRRKGVSPCNNTTTSCAVVEISVNTPPTAPTGIDGTDIIEAGKSTTLTASGGDEGSSCIYQWGTGSCGDNIISGQTEISITVSPTATTTYWVRRVGAAPCNGATDCATITVTVNTVGIDEITGDNIKIYPNPVQNLLTIESEDANLAAEYVKIYDMLGKEVLERKLSDGKVDVSQLSPGAYFLKINGYTVKFVKE